MALRYRQLEQPTLLNTSLLENGDSQAAASLANAFKSFEGVALQPAANLRAQQGQQEGADAGTSGEPNFREGLRALTAYGQAYNNSAMRSYAVKAEVDAEDQINRLEQEARTDPELFTAKFNAIRDETVKNSPPQARAVLSTIYARRGGEAVNRIRAAQAAELLKEARADTTEGVERTINRIAYLRATDDPLKHAEAEEEEVKLNLLIDGAHNDKTFSDVERTALVKLAQQQIVAQTVAARFQRVLESPYGDPVAFIEKLKKENRTSEALPADEEEKLVASLLADLREKNTLEAASAHRTELETKARYEAGDREATGKLLSGSLSVRYLSDMVAQQRLDPTVARTLLNELQAGDTTADDPKVAFDVRTNLLSYEEDEIRSMPGLTWKTRGELLLKRQEEAQTWKGTQAAKEAADRIDRALGIVPGTMLQGLSEEQKIQRNQALTEWYSEVDKLPPEERQAVVITTAEDVIGRYIRKNKANEAQALRRAKERYLEKVGAVDELGDEARKAYESRVQRFNADIAAAEAEAARK